jgi:hypothetical protein
VTIPRPISPNDLSLSEAKPVRLRLSRARGFNLQTLSLATNGLPAVNVARPSKWGNPFVVGEDGKRADCVLLHIYLLAGKICLTTKASVEDQMAHRRHVADYLHELRGHNLACWCAVDGGPCHAETLLTIANDEPAAVATADDMPHSEAER